MVNCTHLEGLDVGIKAKTADGCEECLKDGTKWVQLRMCLTCGHVGCCDSSIGRHATKHFRKTSHPVMAEFPGRAWKWCYVDNDYV
ncbi:MAG: UBP-type zinc finger domain-containing protein [Candidatus Micrarchaeaceae archaeon]